MKELLSIHQFFSEINCHFQCYAMGRFIQAIDESVWQEFEQNTTPWPGPFLQHAWIGLIFWEKQEHKNKVAENQRQELHHTVWFLKLPLDEQARLSLAARDDLLSRLLETSGHFLQQKTVQKKNASMDKVIYSLENAMKDNPYGFQPKQEAMANFHAIVHKQLNLAGSSYYSQTQAYLASVCNSRKNSSKDLSSNSKNHSIDWQQLGIQGFADLTARLDEKYQGKNNQKLLIDSFNQLPLPVLRVLGLCLENHKISKQLLQVILELVTTHIADNNTNTLASICTLSIRASAQSSDKKLQAQLLQEILTSPVKTDIEVLASISGRCWTQLTDNKTLSLYLEALAITDKKYHPGAFSTILMDLMFTPGMRKNILEAFHYPERSEVLTGAIAAFFNQKELKQ